MSTTPTLVPFRQKTRGFEPIFQVPATVEDFDAIVGKDACKNHAIAEGIYRSILPKLWKKFIETAPAVFGVAVAVKGTRPNKRNPEDGDVTIYEGIDEYLPRVVVAAEAAGKTAELKSFVQAIATEIGFDLTSSGRTKKADKSFYRNAESIIEKVKNGESTWERVAANCTAKGATTTILFDEAGNVNIDSLALAIQEALTGDTSLA